MKNFILFVLFTLFFQGIGKTQPQKIELDISGKPLNEVFFELRDKYGFQFSFNDKLLSTFKISVKKEFESKEEAVAFLLNDFPLGFEKNGDVFVVFSTRKKSGQDNKPVHISGQVVEAGTFEPLPFSYILINNRQIQSDQNGNFSFLASADTTFNLQISHLGFYVYDTLFTSSLKQKFLLHPAVKELGEIKVEGFTVERSTLIGEAAGKMKINHTIAPYLPGFGDNSIYNVLRLMPGVLASGEQSSDLLVWGSYEGQTKLEFDGFTLFGLKNYNDNIGVVNPLLIQNIVVSKGGYNATYDDRVGGIIEITGIKGNLGKPALTVNLNNSTINSLVEIPIGKKSTLLGAFRKTYYELYNPYNLNIFRNNNNPGNSGSQGSGHMNAGNLVDVLVVPDYNFSDGNLKYTFRSDKGDILSAGIYSGGDRFSYNLDGEFGNRVLNNNRSETNKQLGTSLNYGKQWSEKLKTQITLSYSSLKNEFSRFNSFTTGNHGMQQRNEQATKSTNNADELKAEIANTLTLLNGARMELGIGYKRNETLLSENVNNLNELRLNTISDKGYAYVQSFLPVNNTFQLNPGIRAGFNNLTGKTYIDPRLSASFNLTKTLKLNASWGRYHQFLSKMPVVDENLNYVWYWINNNDKKIPVPDATHWVAGLSGNKNNFLFNIEGYYKTTSGITRYYRGTSEIQRGFYSGESRSYGIDFYLKKEYKKNVAWISYTLSKVEENLPFGDEFRAAPQDQRHELKFAGIYNLKSFYFSADYVYGSGFEIMKNFSDNTSIPVYSRLDAALVYKFGWGKFYGNLGFSVLNVFNRENIKYTNLNRIDTGNSELINVHSEAVPFTPAIFLKLKR